MVSLRTVLLSALLSSALAACGGEPQAPDLVPRARAAADVTSGTVPLTVRFSAQADGGDAPLSFEWAFGDGGTAGGPTAEHRFETPGTFDVILRVSDADGDWDEDRVSIQATAPALHVSVSADPPSGRAPLQVRLVPDVAGGVAPYTYAWAFGDGAESEEASPTHTYAVGTWQATVTVTDAVGGTARGSTEVTVAEDLLPAASISASPTAGIAPLAVAFRGTATGGDAPLGWSWDFGDGGVSAKQNADHTFTDPGTFQVSLTVTDEDGDTDTATTSITVQPNAVPQVSASAVPLEGVAPLEVAFQATTEGGDSPLSVSWAFGDGQTATGAAPTHRYTAPGPYTAVVTVTDVNGDSATERLQVRVLADLSPAVSLVAEPARGQVPLDVSFTAQVTQGNPPFMYAWTFGDGTSASDMQKTSHTYTAPGSYTATVQVTDVDGDVATRSVAVQVTPDTVPVAEAVGSPTSGRVPLTVNFLASAQGGEAPLAYHWVFGDGSAPSDLQAPSHLYQNAGTYTAHLTVTDADGDTGTATVAVEVLPDTEPTVQIQVDSQQGWAPLAVAFEAVVTSGEAPFSYAWDLGDGSTAVGRTPSHTYVNPGAYTARVTVTDSDGDVAVDTQDISVASNAVPAVSVTAAPTQGLVPLQVVFDAQASGGDPPLTYSWDFGDGGVASVEDPTHTYLGEGTWIATVTVTDANADAATASVTVQAQQTRPDLAILDLQVVPYGDQVLFAMQVANQGTGASPACRVDVYRDRTTAPVQGELGAYLEVASLAPGETRWEGGYLTVATGQYAGWAQIDARGLVPETDETNNVAGPVVYDVLGAVRINEVRYRSAGTDAACFVELTGPAGTDLSDYSLVGVNGADGADYATVALTGQTMPADGFFVVAQDAGVANGDLVDAAVDLQNGPDSLQLRFASWAVDGLAYGDFTSATPAGEGTPAPAQPDDQSLGRWPDGADSDDNAADFFVLDPPTPGAPNALPGDTCGSAILLDGPGIVTGDTTGAADDYQSSDTGTGGVSCGGDAQRPELVYGIHLLAGQTLTAEITAADFDTVLHARASCDDPATQVECDDDGGAGTLSELTFTAAADGVHYLFVDGFGSSSDHWGPFTMQVTVTGP